MSVYFLTTSWATVSFSQRPCKGPPIFIEKLLHFQSDFPVLTLKKRLGSSRCTDLWSIYTTSARLFARIPSSLKRTFFSSTLLQTSGKIIGAVEVGRFILQVLSLLEWSLYRSSNDREHWRCLAFVWRRSGPGKQLLAAKQILESPGQQNTSGDKIPNV